jgi:hypothetical protein
MSLFPNRAKYNRKFLPVMPPRRPQTLSKPKDTLNKRKERSCKA